MKEELLDEILVIKTTDVHVYIKSHSVHKTASDILQVLQPGMIRHVCISGIIACL